MTELQGRRVRLRPKRLEDAARDYAWSQDRELSELEAAYPVAIPFSSYLRLYALELERHSDGDHRFAIETETGEHIGNGLLFQVDRERSEAEMGILIGERPFWDRGYGTEAVSLLVDFAFTTLELELVYLHTLTANLRARRCFEKAGFLPSPRRPAYGGRDFIVMALGRRRWLQLKKGAPSQKKGAPPELPPSP